jgi:hypothetical protein
MTDRFIYHPSQALVKFFPGDIFKIPPPPFALQEVEKKHFQKATEYIKKMSTFFFRSNNIFTIFFHINIH